jgi:hypothetical protein
LGSEESGLQNISAKTAGKPVSFGDTSSVDSYGYRLVIITKRSSLFDSFDSKASTDQIPSAN